MSPKHRSCRALEVVARIFISPQPIIPSLMTMTLHCCFICGSPPWQIGGSPRAAEIHRVRVKAETADERLVIGVLFDASEYGTNVGVRPHGR